MKKIKIALIGRPNVGKSSLFNRIAQKRIAIVDEMEGVTRDRLYATAEAFGHYFEIIDTGGVDKSCTIPFAEKVRFQAEVAVEEATALIMVVDGKVGLTTLDEEVASLLLRSGKPLILAVNKADSIQQRELFILPFFALGIKIIFPVSATHGHNVVELLEHILSLCPQERGEDVIEGIKVAIVGKPNVGKSTLFNTLLHEERCVVSPIAGTTRDAIDASVLYEENSFIFIDTAGIRKRKSEREMVDKFALIRREYAIERADICILMIDATQGLTTQEKSMARMIEKREKGCLIFCNKWDLVKGFRMEHCIQQLELEAPFLNYCPKIFGSALNGHNVVTIFPQIKEIYNQLHKRVSTGQLNKFIEKAVQRFSPPLLKGRRLRIYYMAQVDSGPPRFVFFVNNPHFLLHSYKKYLMNQFRIKYQFTGVPLIFHLKSKKESQSVS